MGNTATKNKNYDKSKSLISHKTNILTDEDQITTTTTGVAAAPATTTKAKANTTTTLSAPIRTTVYNEQNQQQQQQQRQELLNNLSQQQQQQQHHHQQPEEIIVTTKTTTADRAAAPKRSSSAKATEHQRQQQFKQISTWSLGSLRSGNFNWSFSFSQNAAAQRNSFRQRNKSTRKSLTNLQQLRRSKTTWHKPITNAIFSSHFKESSSAAAHANNLRNFQIERLVAKGAFGIVFKVSKLNGDKQRSKKQQQDNNNSSAAAETAEKTDETQFYALKVLKKSKILAENSVKQIKDEAEIQKLCGHHPFIVQQIDLWQNRHNLHILSEYVPNGELFSKIANFSLDLVRLYLAEIAVAIDFLHNAGIIYRDAKPENILLTQNFHLKLTDFGLSKWLKLGLTTRTMCGTFQYMAPELLRGEAYGHAVDWWSLGIIACQMLTQKSPDFRQFLQLTFLPATPKSSFQTLPERSIDSVDNAIPAVLNEISSISEEKCTDNFLPLEVEALPHEAKDVLKRLLVIDAKQRLRSVMALQKIALYKNLKIDAKTLLKISAIEIIVRDHIKLYEAPTDEQADRLLAAKAFHDF